MTADTRHADEGEQVLAWVVRHAAQLGQAGPAPLRRIRVSTATLAVDVEWSQARPAGRDPAEAGQEGAGEAGAEGVVAVTAPMVGTFYRSREPGAPPFVQVGDVVEPGQQVGIIEAMKLMNPVLAECHGLVSEIVAADGAPVQYEDTLLFLGLDDASGGVFPRL
ncbi:biotin/lipoyl-containing protein [Sphaerisporangium sp. TRM90804]|uniref:acetyl-CoA carboxylase biotin carboxyl carrier protein n=1 Tax=Sphaerisporangium sp. TRM90804 TaxID=3031113 RepID=UPI002447E207|nr:biotin/lipoyl-containing protein [Sphaerisporangium sp. TRM90804]MDH2426170.1 acetyl-CoA carboxylase, biotin carboxyl carrier protein [Sphaerisporangium sp. TRM90804]